MKFDVLYRDNMQPVKLEDFIDVASEQGLMVMDLSGFLLSEDGYLFLEDDCGHYFPIISEEKYIIRLIFEKNKLIDIIY